MHEEETKVLGGLQPEQGLGGRGQVQRDVRRNRVGIRICQVNPACNNHPDPGWTGADEGRHFPVDFLGKGSQLIHGSLIARFEDEDEMGSLHALPSGEVRLERAAGLAPSGTIPRSSTTAARSLREEGVHRGTVPSKNARWNTIWWADGFISIFDVS